MNLSKISLTSFKILKFLIFGYIPKNLIELKKSIFFKKNTGDFYFKTADLMLIYSFSEFQSYYIKIKKKINLICNYNEKLLTFGINNVDKSNTNQKNTNLNLLNKKKNKILNLHKILMYPALRYLDFAGINKIISQIQEIIEWPLRFYKIYQNSKISSIGGILLHGQSGTGKTLLAHVIAGELNIPIIHIYPSSFISSLSGYSEKKIQATFDFAIKNAPIILFIDEIDGIARSRDSEKETDRKIMGQLLISMDSLRIERQLPVFLIAATNQIESIDQVLRRPGRFDREIRLNIPNQQERFLILKHFTDHIKLCENVDLNDISKKTRGFMSGDLSALVKTVSILALSRICATLFKGKYRRKNTNKYINFMIKKTDFERGIFKTQPFLLRSGFVDNNEIFWDQIGALNFVRTILSKYIIEPIRNLNNLICQKNNGAGVLLYGPPGCGKTLIAHATAYESGANFMCIKGPEIFDKFLGESEKKIRLIFDKARSCAPTIIFFDEMDSISSKRSNNNFTSNNGVSDRVVNQLLIEMDGINKKELIYIIGATNRPEVIDKAILRPGRIDKLLFVPFPNKKDKIQILKTISKKITTLPYLNFQFLSEIMPYNYSGADLMSLTKEAVLHNSEIKLNYIFLEITTNGLFSLKIHLISTKDYLISLGKMKKVCILKSLDRKSI